MAGRPGAARSSRRSRRRTRPAPAGDALVGPQQATGIGEPHRQLPRCIALGFGLRPGRGFARPVVGDPAFDELAEHRVAYQPAAGAAAILDLGRQHRLDPAHAFGRRRLVLQRRRWRKGSSRCHNSRALAAVKPEAAMADRHQPVAGIFAQHQRAHPHLGSMVEGTKPAITKLSLWLDFTLSHVFTPARAIGRRRLLGDDALRGEGGSPCLNTASPSPSMWSL